MQSLVLTGVDGDLGLRVAARLSGDPDLRVVPIEASARSAGDLKGALEGIDGVLHLSGDVPTTRALLDAAGSSGVGHVVLLSSATVYGAWPNNPVPLTEDAPLRPNPGLEIALHAAEMERLVSEWRDDHPGTTTAVLRPAVAVAEGHTSALADGLLAVEALRAPEELPPGQFIHLDDLAAAVELAARDRLDGAYNVAPDGWIRGADLRALAGGPPVRLSERAAARLATWRWRLRLAPTPPGLLPYALHPWVVANDRLRALGWAPTHTNEEAFVAGHVPGPLATISPRRRQELALGIATAGLGAIGAAIAWAVRRRVIRGARRGSG
jgi:nucleoside-diphosphate-sugar epimerase